jgi:23S rRNA pseudouridine1911/1915/1917 synthase
MMVAANESASQEYIVASSDAGMRLDRFLKERLPESSRNAIRTWLEEGRVLCNQWAGRKGMRVVPGDRIRVDLLVGERGFALLPDPGLALDILFEDSFLVAVDKPPGVPSHPLKTGETGTVVNALVARYPEMRGVGFSARDAGLLHRLDRETSGVLLAARKPSGFDGLRVEFEQGRVVKVYLALVHGNPGPEGRVEALIGTRSRRADRVEVVRDPARCKGYRSLRPAQTRFRVTREYRSSCLVRLWMTTGARHQLRAHMASIGCPIVGDSVYGSGVDSQSEMQSPPRQLLHAAEIQFFHPACGKRMRIQSPLEKEFAGYIEGLQSA